MVALRHAAQRIQRVSRGAAARRMLGREAAVRAEAEVEGASVYIQFAWRCVCRRKEKLRERLRENEEYFGRMRDALRCDAAGVIQRGWRGRGRSAGGACFMTEIDGPLDGKRSFFACRRALGLGGRGSRPVGSERHRTPRLPRAAPPLAAPLTSPPQPPPPPFRRRRRAPPRRLPHPAPPPRAQGAQAGRGRRPVARAARAQAADAAAQAAARARDPAAEREPEAERRRREADAQAADDAAADARLGAHAAAEAGGRGAAALARCRQREWVPARPRLAGLPRAAASAGPYVMCAPPLRTVPAGNLLCN